jgi:RluA family pseudouridine synthase
VGDLEGGVEFLVNEAPPCVLFEDDHLLVVNKPAGMNTHAPSPYAGEGIYEWLRHREPRWAELAILHRLDKETSGVLVFGKSSEANRSLTAQFTDHTVRKKYLLLSDRPVAKAQSVVESALVRAGEKYLSRPLHAGAERAETRFRRLESRAGRTWVEAEPVTGRTHQIRVHAAASGFPIVGDALYGGSPGERVCLHARELAFQHPVTGAMLEFRAEVDFEADARAALRLAVIGPAQTDAYRVVHGAADGQPGWYVDRLGDLLLSQSEGELSAAQLALLKQWLEAGALRGAYHKILTRQVRQKSVVQASPQAVLGRELPAEVVCVELSGGVLGGAVSGSAR